MPLKIRRGTNALRQTIVPEQGELIYTTDTKKLYIGDGINAGGFPVTGDPFLGLANVIEDLTPQLGGNLDLNAKDITGVGNININGRVTARELFVQPNGLISAIIPKTTNVYTLGNAQKRFKNIYTNNINIDGTFSAPSINADVVADDSTILIDASTGRISTSSLTQAGAASNQVLKWNSAGNNWAPGNLTLDELIDTNIVGQANGNVLTWNDSTSKWIAAAPTGGGGGGATTLNDLTDVSAAAPANGNTIIWNNSLSTWEDASPLLGLATTDFVITPISDDAIDLATNSKRFRSIYAHQLNVNTVNQSLIPIGGTSLDLGTSGKRWNKLYVDDIDVLSNTITLDIYGSSYGEDSVIFTDAATRDINANTIVAVNISGNLTGSVSGNTVGIHTGPSVGDVSGSVFADDSTLLVDGVDGKIRGEVDTEVVTASELYGITSGTYNILNLLRRETGAIANNAEVSKINFGSTINNIQANAWTQSASTDQMVFFPHPDTPDYSEFVKIYSDGSVMIKGETGSSGFDGLGRAPAADLEIVGNVKISGPNEMLLGNMTTAQRDALTPINGMMLYNSTLNKFQGYENGSWVNLV
tara:strand:+ start:310 stop:2070 length:1761 start_codon:yes stop_codon:yes gene_type:complete